MATEATVANSSGDVRDHLKPPQGRGTGSGLPIGASEARRVGMTYSPFAPSCSTSLGTTRTARSPRAGTRCADAVNHSFIASVQASQWGGVAYSPAIRPRPLGPRQGGAFAGGLR